jgi:glycosyltransferase involved in cell wall biosynthesis
LLEAGFFGIPVVASDVDGIPETIESGVSGELVPPGDAEALARALDGVLCDEARARRLGQTLRAQVLADADWRSRFERYARILDPR